MRPAATDPRPRRWPSTSTLNGPMDDKEKTTDHRAVGQADRPTRLSDALRELVGSAALSRDARDAVAEGTGLLAPLQGAA